MQPTRIIYSPAFLALFAAVICVPGGKAFAPYSAVIRSRVTCSSGRHFQAFLARPMSSNDAQEREEEEEVRIKILGDRRRQIRSSLKSAEQLRNFRIKNGLIPELDEDGKPLKSDGKVAVTFTAFMVAAGAVALRVGGRAALVSGLGLDFVTDNPELKDNLDQVLNFAESMDPVTKGAAFVAAWTGVKVLCVDFAGVALALASGVLFGGVLQGAVASAVAATIGSLVAFSLAKLDTPVRRKALELLDEFPSLRGIEKVVAKDGLKAILTLRLAPILPIPIGMYNYIYGVTNVPALDFAGGIFLGSLKPYLLDSYLGIFGLSVVDGSISEGTSIQDVILLVALGVSVLIGVFASQLAAETWDSVLEEVEAEKTDDDVENDNDGIARELGGIKLPEWIVGFQITLQEANLRMNDMVLSEYEAKIWNYTKEEILPANKDPARYPESPESLGAEKGIDYVGGLCDGLVTSPLLFKTVLKYGDPLYDESCDKELQSRKKLDPLLWLPQAKRGTMDGSNDSLPSFQTSQSSASINSPISGKQQEMDLASKALLTRIDDLESRSKRRLDLVEKLLEDLDSR